MRLGWLQVDGPDTTASNSIALKAQPPPLHGQQVYRDVVVTVPNTGVVRAPAADLDPGNLILRGKRISGTLRQACTDVQLEQTIDGASTLTLTVNDWGRQLVRSPLITGATELIFDNISYTLVQVARADNAMTLVFEETAVNLLRQDTSAKKADRATTTRAQFVRSMVREVTVTRIPFACPEINSRQAIAGAKQTP